jgi:hypothetical protein
MALHLWPVQRGAEPLTCGYLLAVNVHAAEIADWLS